MSIFNGVKNMKNLIGEKFDKLTVVKLIYKYNNKNNKYELHWLCKCDCGNEVVVSNNNLISGNTKSCGCLQREKVKLTGYKNKRYNTYNISGSFGIGYTLKGEEFWFDLEDYDKIKNYCWYKNNQGYLISFDYNSNKKIRLHRLIMNPTSDQIIDHINHNTIDNRKSNLRIVTYSQNLMNKSLVSSNTSGITGVSWYEKRNKWKSYITINKKQKFLGYFDNFEDAVRTRKEAEVKYFGEYRNISNK